jgi:hypothetical protein
MPIQTETDYLADPPNRSNSTNYTFPRTVNGKPLYSENDKTFTIPYGYMLRFTGKHMRMGPQKPQDFPASPTGYQADIPIASLMYKGKLEYGLYF